MTTPRDQSFPEIIADLQRRMHDLEMLTIGRPSVDPSAAWTSWDPVFYAGITAIGDGEASGYYRANEGRVTFDLLVRIGASTTFDADEFQIEIPSTVITNTTRSAVAGMATLVDNSAYATGGIYTGTCVLGYLPEIIYALDLGGVFRFYFGPEPKDPLTGTAPITLATNDLLLAQVTVPGTLAG